MFRELEKRIEESSNIVFLGGAGVSTESGIPDFRSEAGLYTMINEYGRPAEEIICRPFFQRKPAVFFDYYMKNLIYPDAQPNEAHFGLARLERKGRLKAVITQNIDGLHQKAGSKNVIELHGAVARNYCVDCGEKYALAYLQDRGNWKDGVPVCSKCGGIVRPDIVLYEEEVNETILEKARRAISEADMVMVGGTSLVVYPAAGLLDGYTGNNLVLINKRPTPYDRRADLVLNMPIAEVFANLVF